MLEAQAGLRALVDPSSANGSDPLAVEPTIVTLEAFAAVDEPGADALVGEADSALIPENGDVMVYGDGGAGKTTLTIDLACHLAAGQPWLEIPVARPARVLLIENEGPRPLLRRKLGRKLRDWTGSELDGRVLVYEAPWGGFTFAAPEARAALAAAVRQLEIDVVICGPLTRIGMDDAGTLQEVGRFMGHLADVRHQCGRPLTIIVVHHENKSGSVSGAWEGASDTLLHVQGAGNGHTILGVQKARWASDLHGKTLHLAWADGDGFTIEDGERDYASEIAALLSDGEWRTVKEIAAPREPKRPGDRPGIGASDREVKAALDQHQELFEQRTGEDAKALGRQKTAIVWALRSASNAPNAAPQQTAFLGGAEEGAASVRLPFRGTQPGRTHPRDSAEGAFTASAHPTHLTDPEAETADE